MFYVNPQAGIKLTQIIPLSPPPYIILHSIQEWTYHTDQVDRDAGLTCTWHLTSLYVPQRSCKVAQWDQRTKIYVFLWLMQLLSSSHAPSPEPLDTLWTLQKPQILLLDWLINSKYTAIYMADCSVNIL